MKTDMNPFKHFGSSHLVTRFDSPMDAIKTISKLNGAGLVAPEMRAQPSFYSYESFDSLATKCSEGDKATAERAAKLMKEIRAVSYETRKRQRVTSPYGRVSVGSYLASDPMPCRRKVRTPSNHAPLSIVVSLNSMAHVPTSALEKRGVAIAALVRRLVAERPVDLYLSRFSNAGGKDSCVLVRFPTAPIDSYRLAWLLSSQGFARGFGFAYHLSAPELANKRHHADWTVKNYVSGIQFAGGAGYSQSRHCRYSLDLKEFLRTDILYIPGSDPAIADYRAMIASPVNWVNETMAELTTSKPKKG